MKEPVDHIIRPQLPWRSIESAITECGYDVSKVKSLTREEYFARKKEMGAQRCALFTCMTCASTAERWGIWDDDPRRAVEREIAWECTSSRRSDRGTLLRDELEAIAALIDAHREEFDQFIATLNGRREWLVRKAARKPATREPGTPL